MPLIASRLADAVLRTKKGEDLRKPIRDLFETSMLFVEASVM